MGEREVKRGRELSGLKIKRPDGGNKGVRSGRDVTEKIKKELRSVLEVKRGT